MEAHDCPVLFESELDLLQVGFDSHGTVLRHSLLQRQTPISAVCHELLVARE